MSPMTGVSILVVCTGNICRSPMAERMLVAELAALGTGGVAVSSAGTGAVVGADMEPEVRTILAERGLDGAGFAARQLEPGHVRSADLVLTAAREHRGAVLAMDPRALRRSFTIREMARLSGLPDVVAAGADLAGAAGVRARVAAAASLRGSARPSRASDDDIADPYRKPIAAFEACADLMQPALSGVATMLAGCDEWQSPL
jgi:protein-tyrosine phosphatase